MTARPRLTASTINDDELEALYAELDRLRAAAQDPSTPENGLSARLARPEPEPEAQDTQSFPDASQSRTANPTNSASEVRVTNQPGHAPHSCRNCEGIDPDTCLMNPYRGGPVDLRTVVYRILNVESEFVGCPSATTDRIMDAVRRAIRPADQAFSAFTEKAPHGSRHREAPDLRQDIAAALEAANYAPGMRRGDLADAVMPAVETEMRALRVEAELRELERNGIAADLVDMKHRAEQAEAELEQLRRQRRALERAHVELVTEGARKRVAIGRVQNLHQPMQRGGQTICAHCSGWTGTRCTGVVTPHPCPTLQALDQPTHTTQPDEGTAR